MTNSLSERRLAENQVIFRRKNENVTKNLKTLKEAVDSEGEASIVSDIDLPLHFYCECSDENCKRRIVLKPSEYNELHQNSSQFIVWPGHVVPKIERVVHSTDKLIVVEKMNTPPKVKAEDKLNTTNVDFA